MFSGHGTRGASLRAARSRRATHSQSHHGINNNSSNHGPPWRGPHIAARYPERRGAFRPARRSSVHHAARRHPWRGGRERDPPLNVKRIPKTRCAGFCVRSLRSRVGHGWRPGPARSAFCALRFALPSRVRSLRSPLLRRALDCGSPSGCWSPCAAGAGRARLPPSRFAGSSFWLLWGVSCSLCLLFLRPLRWCVPRASGLRPGLGWPWASRSAPRRWRCPAWSRWRALRRPPPPLGLPAPGRAACRWPVAVAGCAPFPLLLALRRRGWFPFRSRRRPFLFAGVARRAALRLCLPPAARWRLSGGVVSVPSASGRVGAAGAPAPGRQLRRLSPALAGARWRALPGGALWLAPAGGVPVSPRPAVRPAARPRWPFGPAGAAAHRPRRAVAAVRPARRVARSRSPWVRGLARPGPAVLIDSIKNKLLFLIKKLICFYYFVIIYDKDMD